MSCPVCPMKMTYDTAKLIHKACGSCQRQIKQMLSGFQGVKIESRSDRVVWDNTTGYEEWANSLTEEDARTVILRKKDEYVTQRCDVRDMKRIVGLPKFLPLEDQVFTAWINEGVKDEKIQEVLGLTYSQLFHVKKIVKLRLQRQMAYYHSIKRLDKETKRERPRV